MESVFRYQFDHNASGAQRTVAAFCLALDEGADPPQEFMARFAHETPVVLPASACTFSAESGVRDRGGVRALLFRVSRLAWVDRTTVEAEGGYHEGFLSASSNTYRVEWRNGRWDVTRDRLDVIS